MIDELSQAEFEGLELKIVEVREEFLTELSKDRNLSRLFAEWQELQRMSVDARRARREAEIHESTPPK